MPRFHFDENVSSHIAGHLRDRGHDVVTSWALGLNGADDDVQLAWATAESRILVTNNGVDSVLLPKAWIRWSLRWTAIQEQRQGTTLQLPEHHGGILIIPQAPHITHLQAAREIDRFASAAGTLTDLCFVYDWQGGNGWLRDITDLIRDAPPNLPPPLP